MKLDHLKVQRLELLFLNLAEGMRFFTDWVCLKVQWDELLFKSLTTFAGPNWNFFLKWLPIIFCSLYSHDERIAARAKQPSLNTSIFHTKLETPKTQVFNVSLKSYVKYYWILFFAKICYWNRRLNRFMFYIWICIQFKLMVSEVSQ